jgi:hypothetical protein
MTSSPAAKMMLKANGRRGVPQGGHLATAQQRYLHEGGEMLERAKVVTGNGKYTLL